MDCPIRSRMDGNRMKMSFKLEGGQTANWIISFISVLLFIRFFLKLSLKYFDCPENRFEKTEKESKLSSRRSFDVLASLDKPKGKFRELIFSIENEICQLNELLYRERNETEPT